jgi:hypothetical protein
VLLKPVDFGDLVVLHTEETTSTVNITRAEKRIYPGAKVHAIAVEAGMRYK